MAILKNVTAAAAAAADEEHKPIIAERFKTKMCKNYDEKGVCPYETRCMFAHGEHDLRTKEMNMRDGLVTEEAVKIFQRVRRMAQRNKLPASLAKQQRSATTAPAAAPAPSTPKVQVRRNDPYAFQAFCDCEECRALIDSPVCDCHECVPYAYASEEYGSDQGFDHEYSYEAGSECDCAECRAASKYVALPPPSYTESVMLVP